MSAGLSMQFPKRVPCSSYRPLSPHLHLCQAFGLIVRRINDEPFDVPSVPGSRAVTIKFMIPNSRMGSVIGKQGCKIKEIQDASGARLNASEGMLPGSTEVALLYHLATHDLHMTAGIKCGGCCGCYPYSDLLHRQHPHRSSRTHAFYQSLLLPSF